MRLLASLFAATSIGMLHASPAPTPTTTAAPANAATPAASADAPVLAKPPLFPSPLPDPAAQLKGRALLSELQRGGYVIFFRHMNHLETLPPGVHHSALPCQGPVYLSEKGKRDADEVGSFFRAQKIPVGELISSPMCRVAESADRAFGESKKEPRFRGESTPEMNGMPTLASHFRQPVPRGENKVLFAQVTGMLALAGHPIVEQGEAVIVRPSEKPVIVARVKADEWKALTAD
jgi:hypothetical protein